MRSPDRHTWPQNRDIVHDATRRDIWVRRWAIVLTLFIAGMTMAMDLIVLLNTFLSGATLTTPFLLKVVLIFLSSGGRMHALCCRPARLLGSIPGTSTSCGLWCYRALHSLLLVQDFLSSVRRCKHAKHSSIRKKLPIWKIYNRKLSYYWQQKGTLPAGLNQLNDSISNYNVPTNAQSGQAYRYVV